MATLRSKGEGEPTARKLAVLAAPLSPASPVPNPYAGSLPPGRKSSAITCAKRMSQFLGDDRIRDKVGAAPRSAVKRVIGEHWAAVCTAQRWRSSWGTAAVARRWAAAVVWSWEAATAGASWGM